MSDRCKISFLSPNCCFYVSSHAYEWKACSQAKDKDDDGRGSHDDGDDDDDDHHHDDQ